MSTDALIIAEVMKAFGPVERPEHFTNHLHCEECAEHDDVLRLHDRESLKIDDVSNPGWDPISFCSPQGKAYYMPTLVRFALEESPDSYYLMQLISHLEVGGPDSPIISYCSKPQCLSIANFIEHVVHSRASYVESYDATDQVLRAYGYWLANT